MAGAPRTSRTTRTPIAALMVIVAALAAWLAPYPDGRPLAQFAPSTLLADASTLASDRFEGRGPGTEGLEAAADLIAERLRSCGVVPAGMDGGYFQPFDIAAPVAIGPASTVILRSGTGETALRPHDDWRPMPFSASKHVRGPLVHVGPKLPPKDAIDLQSAVLVVHDFHGANLRLLATAARERGAAALLALDRPDDPGGVLPGDGEWNAGDAGIPAIRVRFAAIEPVLAGAGLTAETLRGRPTTATAVPGVEADLALDLVRPPAKLRNVIGRIAGTRGDGTAIVLGAHYDHLGRGGPSSLATADARAATHPGADDNASGVAVALAVACELSRGPLARDVVVAFFAGEEIGLLGSSHYVAHPSQPIENTIAMLNLDMVGRLRRDRLIVFGSGTAEQLPALLHRVARRNGLDLALQRDGIGPSDHTSFFLANRPVLHFFTGAHEDYHRPSDRPERLNADGMARVASTVLATLDTLAARERPLTFVAASDSSSMRGGGYGAYLGTIPEFGRTTAGVELAGVRDASPAHGAGLQRGDVILGLGGVTVNDLYDLTHALRSHSPGDHVRVEYLRGGRRRQVEVVLGSRQ